MPPPISDGLSSPTGRVGVRDITEVDSTLSTRDLMQRKLILMKKMLRNERKASSDFKQRLSEMDKEMHSSNFTLRKLEEQRNER